MRALFSSVLAGLLLLSATGVRAQTPGFGVGVGEGVMVSGAVRADHNRGVPTVTSMTSSARDDVTNETFTVTIRFSEDVTGLSTSDISVLHGNTVSAVQGTDDRYTVDVEPDEDFEGDVTVTIRRDAVRSVSTQDGNDEESEDFEVDTKLPELDDATVDRDELILTYDEHLDRTSAPDPNDFDVLVDGSTFDVLRVSIFREEVILILDDAVSRGDPVRLDYDPGSEPIQDIPGNEASSLTNKSVENDTQSADDLPSAPRDLTATAVDRTEIDLKWDAPSDNGGSRITGYRIEFSDTGSGGWDDLVDDTDDTKTSYTHTGLEPGTRQYYRVAAINRDGEGPWSDIDDATTEGGVPGVPRNLTAVESGSSRINLSWSAPISDGGSRITGYEIEVSSNGGRTWTVRVSNTRSSSTTYAHTGLESGTTWHYRVSAINSEGTGEPSNVASETTDIGPPRAPSSLSAVAPGESQIRLSWAPPSDDGGARITGYRIDVSTSGGALWTVLNGNTGSISTAYTHTNLPPGSRRSYRVAAINSQGRGAYSNTASATTRAVVPDAPTNLTATASGQTQVNLSWRAPLMDGGARITGYRVEWSATGGTPWNVLTSRHTSTTYTHRGLSPATTRHYRVSAINSVGTGDASNVATATTDATVPSAPVRLSARANGQNQIDLTWTAPTTDGGAPVTGYRIESSPNGSSWTPLRSNTGSNATSYSHTGLAPATKRYYRVYAINIAGRSPASNVANATTDATVPAAPTNLSANASGTSQIDLSWRAPSFNGGSRITGYRIEFGESGNGPWLALVANTLSGSTSYSDTGLAPATTRYYRVFAINAVGSGTESGVANATTDATVPDAPTNLIATATEPTRIDLVWTAPAYDGGSPVTGYRIEVSEDGAVWADLVRSTAVTTTAYGHTGLMPGSTRHYRVSAINFAGTGAPSNIATASTDDPRDRAGRVNAEVLSHAAAAMTSSTVSAIASRAESFAASDPFGRRVQVGGFRSLGAAAAAMRPGAYGQGALGAGAGTDVDLRRLLNGASFTLPIGDALPQLGSNPSLATWGSGEYHSMSRARGGLVAWEGDMLSMHMGADVRVRPHILAGVAATRSTGNFDFTDKTGATEVAGTYASQMTSLNPYVVGFLGRVDITGWATGGYGWGNVEIEDERKELRSSPVRMLNGAVGGAGDLLASGSASLRLKAEGWLSRVEVEGGEQVDSLTLDMRRARVALQVEAGIPVRGGTRGVGSARRRRALRQR